MWAIDLGTTNTGVARWDEVESRPRLVELPEICRHPGAMDHLEAPLLVPSVTQVFENLDVWSRLGRWGPLQQRMFLGRLAYIGRPALENNEGQKRASFVPTWKPYLGRAPLRTLARAGRQGVSARDVARTFIRELLAEIRRTTGERIRDLVVTTPVDAYESYRAELAEILRSLGVRRVRFVDEPVAAALGYGLGLKQRRLALVVDFGGGTLDVALVALTARGVEQGSCEVIAKEGRQVGGNDVDRWLLRSFCERLEYPLGPDETLENTFWYRMMLAETCRVKESVFFNDGATFLPTPPDDLFRFDERIRGESKTLRITRDDVVSVLTEHSLYETLEACVSGVFAQAEKQGVQEKDVEDVLMVGGSTLLPKVYSMFEARFGRDAVRAWQPFEAVAYGACALAADASHQSDFIVHDYAFVTHDLQTHERQYSVIVPHGTRFPTAPDFWTRQLVPTCSLGEPETMFKLVICEIGEDRGVERRFSWDKEGRLHKIGGKNVEPKAKLIVPLNEANPTLGYLKPPHPPSDKRPRLEISFGVNAERWLCASVYDLRTKRYMMREEAVVRLL